MQYALGVVVFVRILVYTCDPSTHGFCREFILSEKGISVMWKDWLESFLEENYSNPSLEFKDVMVCFRFSKSYGCTLFKVYLGTTFREKLREVRLEKALEFNL